MSRRRNFFPVRGARAVLPLVVLALSACDDDPVAPSSVLSQAEAEALAGAVLADGVGPALAWVLLGGVPFHIPLEYAATAWGVSPEQVVRLAETIDETIGPEEWECELGGTVTISGSVVGEVADVAPRTGAFDFVLSAVHDGCVAETEEAGTTFVLDGDPGIDSEYAFDLQTDRLLIDGTTSGAVQWQLESGRSGSCGVDLALDVTVMSSGVQGQVTGTVCGRAVSQIIDEPTVG